MALRLLDCAQVYDRFQKHFGSGWLQWMHVACGRDFEAAGAHQAGLLHRYGSMPATLHILRTGFHI